MEEEKEIWCLHGLFCFFLFGFVRCCFPSFACFALLCFVSLYSCSYNLSLMENILACNGALGPRSGVDLRVSGSLLLALPRLLPRLLPREVNLLPGFGFELELWLGTLLRGPTAPAPTLAMGGGLLCWD